MFEYEMESQAVTLGFLSTIGVLVIAPWDYFLRSVLLAAIVIGTVVSMNRAAWAWHTWTLWGQEDQSKLERQALLRQIRFLRDLLTEEQLQAWKAHLQPAWILEKNLQEDLEEATWRMTIPSPSNSDSWRKYVAKRLAAQGGATGSGPVKQPERGESAQVDPVQRIDEYITRRRIE